MNTLWKDIASAPKKKGSMIVGGVTINGITLIRSAKWAEDRVTKYNPDGGFWTCPNMGSVIGPFTHWMPTDQFQIETPHNDK